MSEFIWKEQTWDYAGTYQTSSGGWFTLDDAKPSDNVMELFLRLSAQGKSGDGGGKVRKKVTHKLAIRQAPDFGSVLCDPKNSYWLIEKIGMTWLRVTHRSDRVTCKNCKRCLAKRKKS